MRLTPHKHAGTQQGARMPAARSRRMRSWTKLELHRSGVWVLPVTGIIRSSPGVTSMTWISTGGSFNTATRWRMGTTRSYTVMRKTKQNA